MVVTRTCIGCRARDEKPRLVRFVLSADGVLVQDPAAVLPGRGAYVHPSVACWQAAVKRRAFARALRRPVAVGEPPTGWGADPA
ncbi:YlxR family protein [Propionicicella superfundia]|uniref:YlxR family protein n=1 Tax=Propionicicella superfundia TaxID=348582 RepID=UPI001FE1B7F6|nr:YlxR family protein [Propionicicella superfundia]